MKEHKSLELFKKELGTVKEDMRLIDGVITYHTLTFYSNTYAHGINDDAIITIVDLHKKRINFHYSYQFKRFIKLIEIINMLIKDLDWKEEVSEK